MTGWSEVGTQWPFIIAETKICKMPQMFYQSVVSGALLYTVVCWRSEFKIVGHANKLNKFIRKASSAIEGGIKLDLLGDNDKEKEA